MTLSILNFIRQVDNEIKTSDTFKQIILHHTLYLHYSSHKFVVPLTFTLDSCEEAVIRFLSEKKHYW